jgi:D-alanine-D-alanine ligase
MHVGFIYNIATDELLRERPEMTLRDSDSPETIAAVTRALEAGGHRVTGYNADQRLPAILVEKPFDIAFNIATGVYGESRQTHVPAMLDYLQIPHTGPGVLAEALCHHKPQEKMVFIGNGVPTAPFQLFLRADEPLQPALRFPLICKLTSEGASMGLDYDSVVQDEAALRKKVAFLLEVYQQGVLVEHYLDGREFTVGVLGHSPAYALPVGELHFGGPLRIRLDEMELDQFEQLKRALGRPDLEMSHMESETRAPADLPPATASRIQQIAVAAFNALGCKDWARVDLRMDSVGSIYVLEVNCGPGIAPDYALPKLAYAAGWSYQRLVNTILDHAIERYPHLTGQPAANPHQQYLGSLAQG